jgi:hypothetical protein
MQAAHSTALKQARRWAMSCAALLGLVLLAGCSQSGSGGVDTGVLTSTNGPLTLAVERSPGPRGLTVTLLISNNTSQPMTWYGGCVVPYIVELRITGSRLVQRWPAPPTGPQCLAIAVVTLDSGKRQSFTVVQTENLRGATGAPLAAGTYDVHASFALHAYGATAAPTTVATNVQLIWVG